MLREPFAHFRVLVSGVVVNDRIDLSLGKMRVDVIEETDELLMPVAFHVAADDGAVENVEGGEQRGCAVAFGSPMGILCEHADQTCAAPRQTVFLLALSSRISPRGRRIRSAWRKAACPQKSP